MGFCGLGGVVKKNPPRPHRRENNEMIFESLLNGQEFENSYFRREYSQQEKTAAMTIQKAWRGFFVRHTVYPALRFLIILA